MRKHLRQVRQFATRYQQQPALRCTATQQGLYNRSIHDSVMSQGPIEIAGKNQVPHGVSSSDARSFLPIQVITRGDGHIDRWDKYALVEWEDSAKLKIWCKSRQD